METEHIVINAKVDASKQTFSYEFDPPLDCRTKHTMIGVHAAQFSPRLADNYILHCDALQSAPTQWKALKVLDVFPQGFEYYTQKSQNQDVYPVLATDHRIFNFQMVRDNSLEETLSSNRLVPTSIYLDLLITYKSRRAKRKTFS